MRFVDEVKKYLDETRALKPHLVMPPILQSFVNPYGSLNYFIVMHVFRDNP